MSNKGRFEECDKQENVALTVAATASCLKKKTLKRFVQCHVFAQSPPGQHPNYNSQWTLCTAPICVKMFHLQCYLVATVLIVQSVHRYVYMCICSSQYRDAGRTEEIKIWDNSECRVPRKLFSACHFGHACQKVRQPCSRSRKPQNVTSHKSHHNWCRFIL